MLYVNRTRLEKLVFKIYKVAYIIARLFNLITAPRSVYKINSVSWYEFELKI
jgi:hypothetical protein